MKRKHEELAILRIEWVTPILHDFASLLKVEEISELFHHLLFQYISGSLCLACNLHLISKWKENNRLEIKFDMLPSSAFQFRNTFRIGNNWTWSSEHNENRSQEPFHKLWRTDPSASLSWSHFHRVVGGIWSWWGRDNPAAAERAQIYGEQKFHKRKA